jgi:diguanylate cyclase (GGDEF)-like protein
MRILVVDDDELFSALLKDNLIEQRYTVDTAVNGLEAWELVETFDYDLILLDIILPKLDGISFCRRLRAKGLQVLVLLLTARGTSDDKIMGLDAGADDYVVKPVPLQELEARIRALLRRKARTVSSVLEWANLCLNPSQCEVTYNGIPLNLTAKEYALLELFMGNTQKIHSQSSILNQLWSLEDEPPSGDTVRTLIKRLRQKLKSAGTPDLIETVYGLGYRLNPVFHKVQDKDINSKLPITSRSLSQSFSSTNIWKDSKPKIIKQVVILEEEIRNLNKLPDSSWLKVKQGAHKLIASLGILNFADGVEIVHKIQLILQKAISLQQEEHQSLIISIETLHSLLEKISFPENDLTDVENKTNKLDVKARLLVIDKDTTFIENLTLEAAPLGIQTTMVSNAQLARDAIQRVRPDIVLLDMSKAEEREDGLLLLEELSHQNPPVPVLVFTSNQQGIDKVAIARRKGKGFFQKPIAPGYVLETITQILKPVKKIEAKIMVLDDDRMVLRLLRTLLEPWGLHVISVNNSLQFWEELETITPDLLVLDVQMPDIDGIEICQMLRNDSRWAWLPILFLTGQRDIETIQQVFSAGADDYVSKPVVAPELITRIFNRLERTRLIREQAENDILTGLPNRQRANQDLERFLRLAKHYQQPFSLAVLTLDNLVQINRQYGHRQGDQMLRKLAHILRQELRNEDIISRWQGAEFIVGMYGMNRSDGVEWLAEILETLRGIEFQTSEGNTIYTTFSAGITQYPEDGKDLQNLYQTATATLENAKKIGGDKVLPATWRPIESQSFFNVILLHQDSGFASSILDAMKTRGYHIHWLQDGKTAINLLSGQNPSLQAEIILLEDSLPNLSGIELLKHFKRDKMTQRSKVIWLSTDVNIIEKAMSMGCFDYINLPCSTSALLYRLRSIFA